MLTETLFDAAWAPRRPSLDWVRSFLPAVRAHDESAIDEADPKQLVIRTAALTVEAVRRVLDIELHDEQVMAGIALCAGWGVQMRTGEGKTFAAIHPALLFGLCHGGVHVMTANSYLAGRDAEWAGAVLRDLGLTVGVTAPGMTRDDVRRAYACDVTYGAERDFGFDFLRDGLWLPGDEPVQRGRVVAIVDEADAVLLDQARTPLVLSAPAAAATASIRRASRVVADLGSDDVEINKRTRAVQLTDAGMTTCERLLGVPDLFTDSVDWPHRIDMALRARFVLARDHDYVVRDGRVHVVDELTGRIVAGRQWGDGLHQALEAKEGLAIDDERRDIARISIGSYIGGYRRVVGMSGTLEGAERELGETVGMPVLTIPTHRPVVRVDAPDASYADRDAKHAAVADDVAERHASGQPVLVGTRSIEESRAFSAALDARGVAHDVLSAEHPELEAAVVAQAGRVGAVTVATQMAGRGVDIRLEHSEPGLMVWGLGHHPSRRLDQQLRGRSGRQGDPGMSTFAVAADDDVPAAEQDLVEQLEADSRNEARRYAAAYDRMQDLVMVWREKAQTGDLAALIDDAVDTTAPALRRRRRRAAVEARRAAIDARAADFGHAYDAVARLTLGQLLVLRWADFLAALDTLERFSHLAGGSLGDTRWEGLTRDRFAAFLRDTKDEWLTQLDEMQISHDTPPVAAPVRAEAISDFAPDEVEATMMPDYDSIGLRAANWIRRKWGVVSVWEPPIVLNLEALGDTAPDGAVRVLLDLEDPTKSVAYVR